MEWNVLLIDDEEQLRKLLGRIIRLEGYAVTEAADYAAAKKMLQKETPDIILCDVKLPDANGVEIVKELKAAHPAVEIILLTAYGNIADGVQAMRNGAFDYITKGDDNDKIIPLLSRAVDKLQLAKKIEQLQKQIGHKYSFHTIIGQSPAIKQAITLAEKVAATDTTVLLLGETGTGKEVFAHSIHQQSSRKNRPFVAINSSAFGKELLESELFGHKAGAFTGAVKDKKGLFEEADEGTVFLDEIGEMPAELQAKLLRVLEVGEFIKVGDTKTVKVNVRIIAATNRDLQKEIAAGHFRSDLFYRLSVFQIVLPALRERIKDMPALAEHFTQIFAVKTNKAIPSLQKEYVDALQRYQWPGNIRELKNIIERSVILSDNNMLSVQTLPFDFQNNNDASFSTYHLAGVEKLHIQKVLKHTNGNKTEAAKLMNIGLTTLYRKIEEYHIA